MEVVGPVTVEVVLLGSALVEVGVGEVEGGLLGFLGRAMGSLRGGRGLLLDMQGVLR